MTDMLKAIPTLGFIKTFVLDFPTALGHVEQRSNPHARRRKVCQPVGFDHLAIGLVLTIEEHARGFTAQGIPGIELFGLPDLHAILPIAKDGGGRPQAQAPSCQLALSWLAWSLANSPTVIERRPGSF